MRLACGAVLLAVLIGSATTATTPTATEADASLIALLSGMYQVEVPDEIVIERVPIRVMLERYRKLKITECKAHYRDPYTALRECTSNVPDLKDLGVFVYGWFIIEDSGPDRLHILVWAGSTPKTVVHEWLHWYYFAHRTPPLVHNHDIIYKETDLVISSPMFLGWLMDRESGES